MFTKCCVTDKNTVPSKVKEFFPKSSSKAIRWISYLFIKNILNLSSYFFFHFLANDTANHPVSLMLHLMTTKCS